MLVHQNPHVVDYSAPNIALWWTNMPQRWSVQPLVDQRALLEQPEGPWSLLPSSPDPERDLGPSAVLWGLSGAVIPIEAKPAERPALDRPVSIHSVPLSERRVGPEMRLFLKLQEWRLDLRRVIKGRMENCGTIFTYIESFCSRCPLQVAEYDLQGTMNKPPFGSCSLSESPSKGFMMLSKPDE